MQSDTDYNKLPVIWTSDTLPEDDAEIDKREFEKIAILYGIESAIERMEDEDAESDD